MTNEEKIQELLNEPCWDSKPYLIGMDRVGVEDVMERFGEWKDEQHKQEKQQLIDEACKWLAENDSYAIPTNVQVDRLKSI
jgi:hypothetical protein